LAAVVAVAAVDLAEDSVVVAAMAATTMAVAVKTNKFSSRRNETLQPNCRNEENQKHPAQIPRTIGDSQPVHKNNSRQQTGNDSADI
jgi:hypothetical protein